MGDPDAGAAARSTPPLSVPVIAVSLVTLGAALVTRMRARDR